MNNLVFINEKARVGSKITLPNKFFDPLQAMTAKETQIISTKRKFLPFLLNVI